MGRKKRSDDNPFGFWDLGFGNSGFWGNFDTDNSSIDLGNVDFGFDFNSRERKANRLGINRVQGKTGEDIFRIGEEFQGSEVKRIHKGGDFIVQKRDNWGNKIGKPVTNEIKTGDSILSEAQKARKKRGNFKIVRY